MTRLVLAAAAALLLGGPVSFFWWAFDDDGSKPFWPIFIVGWVVYVLLPEPRPARRRRHPGR